MLPSLIIYIIVGLIVLFFILVLIVAIFGTYETPCNNGCDRNVPINKNIYDPLSPKCKLYSLPPNVASINR